MSAQTERDVTMRFLTDPEFHGRVMTAVRLTEWTMRRETGMDTTPAFHASFIQACSYGLFMGYAPFEQMAMNREEAVESMKLYAEAMGFTLGRQEIKPDA